MAIPYGRQSITSEDIEAVVSVLKSDYLTQGPEIEKFEKSFSEHVHSPFSVAVANGTAALHLAALSLGVKEGSRWISTPITFAASTNAILYCGGEVDFVDIDPKTFTMDLDKIETKLAQAPSGHYQGVVPVDFAGYPVNLERLRDIADRYNLKILEDACHAPGGAFRDSSGHWQHCGNGRYADAAIFSFHPVKHIACGEGGMVTTAQREVYYELLKLRTHGITKDESLFEGASPGPWYYEMQELGYNYRLTDFQAALGRSQLRRADEGLQKRTSLAKRYGEKLSKLPYLKIPHVGDDVKHAFHLYVIQVNPDIRKRLFMHLREKNILAQVHYVPVHLHPFYQKNFKFKQGDFPLAERYYESAISLPMFPTLSEIEQDLVVDALKSFNL